MLTLQTKRRGMDACSISRLGSERLSEDEDRDGDGDVYIKTTCRSDGLCPLEFLIYYSTHYIALFPICNNYPETAIMFRVLINATLLCKSLQNKPHKHLLTTPQYPSAPSPSQTPNQTPSPQTRPETRTSATAKVSSSSRAPASATPTARASAARPLAAAASAQQKPWPTSRASRAAASTRRGMVP